MKQLQLPAVFLVIFSSFNLMSAVLGALRRNLNTSQHHCFPRPSTARRPGGADRNLSHDKISRPGHSSHRSLSPPPIRLLEPWSPFLFVKMFVSSNTLLGLCAKKKTLSCSHQHVHPLICENEFLPSLLLNSLATVDLICVSHWLQVSVASTACSDMNPLVRFAS